jgi:phenylalanine-4-hydroxylase
MARMHTPGPAAAASLDHAMIDDAQARAAQAYAEHFDGSAALDPARIYIDQRYAGYSEENHQTWRALYLAQLPLLSRCASRSWLAGARAIALGPERVPRLAEIGARLTRSTGWQSRAVPGYLPPRAFFACLARREFPTTIVIRPRAQLGYLPQPDIFHDVFGHVPLHADPAFADFLELWGRSALEARDEARLAQLTRLFWFSVEFGLIREAGELKLYGSGLISSPAEARHALEAAEVERREFDLDEICQTPFEIDHYQPLLFVLESFAQLRDAMAEWAKRAR